MVNAKDWKLTGKEAKAVHDLVQAVIESRAKKLDPKINVLIISLTSILLDLVTEVEV